MNNRIVRSIVMAACGMSLAACSSMSVDKVWPFDGKKEQGQPARLAGATEYQCEGGRRFYVRFADNGNTAWLIYPDREVALARSGSGTRYSNGIAVLDVGGDQATLNDGPAVDYKGCKKAAPANGK